MSDNGYIYNYEHDGLKVADITNTALQLVLNYQEPDAATPTDHPPPPGFPLPSSVTTPLSQQFDTFWGVTKDANGKTPRDRAVDRIATILQQQVRRQGDKYTAYDIDSQLPLSGSLRALSDQGKLFLSYWLPGADIRFTSTTPSSGGLISDPQFRLTFDIEFFFVLDIPAIPCDMTVQGASLNAHNAHINPANLTATIGGAIQAIGDFFSDRPIAAFQSAEGGVDSTHEPIGDSPIGPFLAQIAKPCAKARTIGFLKFGVFTNANTPTLGFRFTHPVDPAPEIHDYNSLPAGPFFAVADPTQSRPGDMVSVSCTGLNFAPSPEITILWQDSTSGGTISTEIQWGPVGGAVKSITKTRDASGNDNNFTGKGLLPNVAYQFRVRDSDLLTRTPWSDWAIRTPQGGRVDLLLEYNSKKVPVGTASAVNGVLKTHITVPTDVSAGPHLLWLMLNGSPLVSISLSILGPNQSRTAKIEIVYRDTVVLVTGAAFTLRGEGFNAGQLRVTLDDPNGTFVGTVTADTDGKFTADLVWPDDVAGKHEIVATQSVEGGAIAATTTAQALVSGFLH
jgi:hypothetical protein